MRSFVKPALRDLIPYQNGSHTRELIDNHREVLKLDSNEATHGVSARVSAVLRDYVCQGPVNWYPDVESLALRRALSAYTGLGMDHILTFNGSDHALETIARAIFGAGDEAILFPPTYDHFRVYAQSCDAELVAAPENSGHTLALRIAKAVSPNSRLVYLVNPNNPTGFITPVAEIQEAARLYPDIVFLVDEAYYEFCGVTAVHLVLELPNIIVTRSFSKAFGLASLRCGYLLAPPSLAADINKIRVGKHVNALAQEAAVAALDDIENTRRYVEEVAFTRRWLIGEMAKLGVASTDTPLNFILIKVADAPGVTAFLKSHKVYVRDRSKIPGLAGTIRVTVGDRFVMKRFLRVFHEIPADLLGAVENDALAPPALKPRITANPSG